jgi:chromosome segregation ATPase
MSGKAEEDDEWRADSRSYDARRENNELQILLDENAKLKESLSLSQAECDDLKSKLASISQSLDKESKTNEALLSAQNMLQMQSNSLKEESKALRTELNKEIERRTKQDAELKEVQQQWSNTKKENEVHKKTIGELKERLHTAECEISQLSTPALNRSASSAIKNEDSDRELENLLMRIRGEKNDVERALVGAEKSLVAMKAERDSLSEQLERLRLVSQQRAARLEQDAEDARREAVSHRSLNSDLTAKLTASQKMLDEIRSRPMAAVSTTEFNIDSSMNYKLSDLQLELEGERAKSNRLESQISAMRQELADMDSQLAQSRRRSTELEDRCNSTDFACRSLESKLALEMAAHQQLNAQLRSREEDVRNLERAVDAKETAQLSSQEEIAQLRVQCVELEKQLSALSTKARDEPNSAVSNSSNADIVVRLEAAQVRLVQLEADLRDERRRVSFLEAELAQKQQWADRSAESERNAKSSLYEALNKIRDLQAESDAMKALLVRSSESRQVNDSVSVGSSADVLQSRLVDAEHQIQSLSLRASRLEEDLIVSRRDAETADRLRRDLDASLVTAKEQISALRSEQLQDKTILFETQLLLERGQRKIVALESELSDALRENTLNKENHRSQRENLEKRLLEIASRKDAEVLKLQDDVARERANAEAHRSEELVLQHRTQQLEAQIAVLTREKCELFSRCEELSSIQEQPVATTPVASSDASVDSLRNTLHEKQREIVALHARIRSLEVDKQ